MAAQPATARADDASLMWLDDADLLSVSERFDAADSGISVFAKCIVPGVGLFAAVLFGHIIVAAAGQAAPAGARQPTAASETRAASTVQRSEAAPTPRATPAPASALEAEPAETAKPAADSDSELAAGSDKAPAATAQPQAQAAEPGTSPAPRDHDGRSHRQPYDDGARGSGATVKSADGEPSAARSPSQPGLLRINSRPWAVVTLDGKDEPLGHTPLFDVQVSPGSHTLRLDNPDFQVSKTIHVDVGPGETVTRVVSLQE